MIDYEYVKYITEIILGESQSEKLMTLRFDALRKLRGMVAHYEEQNFLPWLVEKVFCKKADYLMCATTKKDIEEILRPSVPIYSGVGFYPKYKFHVEEEELILWSIVSSNAGVKLFPEANKRYMELFEKIVGYDNETDAA